MSMPTFVDNTTPLSAANLNAIVTDVNAKMILDTSTSTPTVKANGVDITASLASALYNDIVGNAINASY